LLMVTVGGVVSGGMTTSPTRPGRLEPLAARLSRQPLSA